MPAYPPTPELVAGAAGLGLGVGWGAAWRGGGGGAFGGGAFGSGAWMGASAACGVCSIGMPSGVTGFACHTCVHLLQRTLRPSGGNTA
jgi:hypothetical protein